MRTFILLFAVATLSGCASAPTIADLNPFVKRDQKETASVVPAPVDQAARNDFAAGWTSTPPDQGAPVLYGRDGSPVGSGQRGEVVQSARPLNDGVDSGGGSRPVVLELYTSTKNELEQLIVDFEGLSRESQAAAATITEQKTRIATLEAKVAELTTRNGELDTVQFELMGRLAQAQIARLEAERALLEASVDWRRMNAANTRTTEEPRR